MRLTRVGVRSAQAFHDDAPDEHERADEQVDRVARTDVGIDVMAEGGQVGGEQTANDLYGQKKRRQHDA